LIIMFANGIGSLLISSSKTPLILPVWADTKCAKNTDSVRSKVTFSVFNC